jgi:hypothetical protein
LESIGNALKIISKTDPLIPIEQSIVNVIKDNPFLWKEAGIQLLHEAKMTAEVSNQAIHEAEMTAKVSNQAIHPLDILNSLNDGKLQDKAADSSINYDKEKTTSNSPIGHDKVKTTSKSPYDYDEDKALSNYSTPRNKEKTTSNSLIGYDKVKTTSKSPYDYDEDMTLCNNSTRHDKTKAQMPAELSNPFLDEANTSAEIFKLNKSKNAYKNHFEELTDGDELDQSDNFDELMDDNSSESDFDNLGKHKMVWKPGIFY